jgi:hypothetical protein
VEPLTASARAKERRSSPFRCTWITCGPPGVKDDELRGMLDRFHQHAEKIIVLAEKAQGDWNNIDAAHGFARFQQLPTRVLYETIQRLQTHREDLLILGRNMELEIVQPAFDAGLMGSGISLRS